MGEWRVFGNDWDKRCRVLGKSLSTIRMSLRIANFLEGMRFFMKRKKDPESKKKSK